MTVTPTETLLDQREAAKFLKLSPRQLEKLRYQGGGPAFIRLGHRSVRYAPSALAAWLDGRTFTNTAQEKA